MSKRAFLVLGAESTGTRMLTEILIRCGCAGDSSHEQRFDESPPVDESLVVWRRSFPHDGAWPDLSKIANTLSKQDYQLTALVTTREPYATIRSQLMAGHVDKSRKARSNIRFAYHNIINALFELDVPFFVVTFESFIHDAVETTRSLCELLGLQYPGDEQALAVYDANRKHYAKH